MQSILASMLTLDEISSFLDINEDAYGDDSIEGVALQATKFMLADDIPLLKNATFSHGVFLEVLFAEVWSLMDTISLFQESPEAWGLSGFYNRTLLQMYGELELVPTLRDEKVDELVALTIIHSFSQIEKSMQYCEGMTQRKVSVEKMHYFLRCLFAFLYKIGVSVDAKFLATRKEE